MVDHQDVGVQTWGSAILLGREMALRPEAFGLLAQDREARVLELGAGTGLLSILCRKLLDLHHLSLGKTGASSGLVVASDYHNLVLSNLKTCIDLNFPSHSTGNGLADAELSDGQDESGIHVAKLDWATFPRCMAANGGLESGDQEAQKSMRLLNKPFDLVLASDCVYDPSHASMLRQVTSWVLRTPSPGQKDDNGGTFVCPALLLGISRAQLLK